ncbi:MAG: hypothetical protein LBJ76_00800 [Candidatus Accumulibacter sp.]|nr:hypothetical protein [Accumulibacter sp.]
MERWDEFRVIRDEARKIQNEVLADMGLPPTNPPPPPSPPPVAPSPGESVSIGQDAGNPQQQLAAPPNPAEGQGIEGALPGAEPVEPVESVESVESERARFAEKAAALSKSLVTLEAAEASEAEKEQALQVVTEGVAGLSAEPTETGTLAVSGPGARSVVKAIVPGARMLTRSDGAVVVGKSAAPQVIEAIQNAKTLWNRGQSSSSQTVTSATFAPLTERAKVPEASVPSVPEAAIPEASVPPVSMGNAPVPEAGVPETRAYAGQPGAPSADERQEANRAAREARRKAFESRYKTTIYTVNTEDDGSFDVKLLRDNDGNVVIFDMSDNVPHIKLPAAFAKDKTDEAVLAYEYEPLGYLSSTEQASPDARGESRPSNAESQGLTGDADGDGRVQERLRPEVEKPSETLRQDKAEAAGAKEDSTLGNAPVPGGRISPVRRKSRRYDLIGDIIDLGGLSPAIAPDVVSDTAFHSHLPGLFQRGASEDLSYMSRLLNETHGWNLDEDGRELSDLIRRAAFGERITSPEQTEAELNAGKERQYRDSIRQEAEKLNRRLPKGQNIRTVGVKFTALERQVSEVNEARLKEVRAQLKKREAAYSERFWRAYEQARSILAEEEIDAILDAIPDNNHVSWLARARKELEQTYERINAEKDAYERGGRSDPSSGQSTGPENERETAPEQGVHGGPSGARSGGSGEYVRTGGDRDVERSSGRQESQEKESKHPGLTLEGQTEAEAKESERLREESDQGLSKEQIDREREAFTLSGESQAKPQGSQSNLFTPDGRASQAAEAKASSEAFIPAPGGENDYGAITPEMARAMKRQSGPIRLQQGIQNADGTGWGLAHIEANHGEQIRRAGFASVEDFVSRIAANFNRVLQTSNAQLLVAITDGRQEVMFIQLSPSSEGDFYRVNTAFPASRDYLAKQERKKGYRMLWDGSEPASAVAGQQPLYAGSPESKSGQDAPIAQGQSSDPTIAQNADSGSAGETYDQRYYRRHHSGDGMSEWGHAMMSDEEERVGHYGPKLFIAELDGNYVGDELRETIIEAWRKSEEEGNAPEGYGPEDSDELSDEEIIDLFNPEDIVDSAAGFDNGELAEWFYRNVVEPNDLTYVTTYDGAVVFDPALLERVQEEYEQSGAPKNAVEKPEAMRRLVDSALSETNANQTVRIVPVSEQEARAASEQAGLDISGYTHTADMFAVRHALNQHGDAKKEARRGQIAIGREDVAAVPDTLAAPDAVVYGAKNNRGQDLIASIKRMPDGTLLMVEEVRTGKKTLALTSLRKYPAAKDFSSIARTLLSNAQSDGGNGLIIFDPKQANKKLSIPQDFSVAGKAVAEQLAATGRYSPKEVSSYAALVDAFYKTLATRTGMPVDELWTKYPLKVVAMLDAMSRAGFDQSAYHGSPHRFSKFTLDHIGSGEGAQAYGWGLYFTDLREIGEFYRTKLTRNRQVERFYRKPGAEYSRFVLTNEGWVAENDDASDFMKATVAETLGLNLADAVGINQARRDIEAFLGEDDKRLSDKGREILDSCDTSDFYILLDAENFLKDIEVGKDEGQLYIAEIPDNDVLLDWDTPLSEQPEKVKKALSGLKKLLPKNALPDLDGDWNVLFGDENTGSEFYETLTALVGSDKRASTLLNQAGIPGLRYLDGVSRGKGEGTHNYVIFDDQTIEILETFYQNEKNGKSPRGSFDPKRLLTTLFEGADRSTFLHENGHFFLQMYENLIGDALSSGTPLTRGRMILQQDFLNAIRWAGFEGSFKDWQKLSMNEKRPVHEKFARGFEAYLREGKAPTPKLKGIFESFKEWLRAIYKRLTDLKVQLTPDVRSLMDRMLTTDGDEGVSTGMDAAKGRAQPLTSRVLTPSGYRFMGEIRAGDAVIAADGSTTTVTAVYPQGKKPIYRIVLSDGSRARSTADHLWKVREEREEDFKVMPLEAILRGFATGRRYEIPPLAF